MMMMAVLLGVVVTVVADVAAVAVAEREVGVAGLPLLDLWGQQANPYHQHRYLYWCYY